MARGASAISQLTADIDIYRAAKLYIDQHGDQAALQAAMQSDALLEASDLDGAATWRKIIKAIEVLTATKPRYKLQCKQTNCWQRGDRPSEARVIQT